MLPVDLTGGRKSVSRFSEVSVRKTISTVVALAICLVGALSAGSPVSAAPSLRFHGVQYDSPGADNRSNASLNAEWISLINTGTRAVNLTGYTIRDKAGHVYRFGNTTIAARGGRIWLHTGSGTASARTRFWGSRAYIWNNTGDTAYLRTPSGTAADSCAWGYSRDRHWVGC